MTDRKSYDAGWDDCIAYIREKNKLNQSRTGWGGLMMLVGAFGLASGVVAPLMSWLMGVPIVNFQPLVWPFVLGMFFSGAGYVVDKSDAARYKEREQLHYKKWSDRWIELGINGEDR